MIIAADFNGVIHDRSAQSRSMGPPMAGALEGMRELANQGHVLIIYSDMANTPGGVKVIEDWLKYYGVPGSVWQDKGKPKADVYIDDKAVRFSTWRSALAAIARL